MLRRIPDGSVSWSDPRLREAWPVLALAAAVALVLFPRTISISDEGYYAGQALALLHGHLVPTTADALPVVPGRVADSLHYPPGWPLLLAPFRSLGFRAMFGASLAMHLLGAAAAARMLVRRGLPAWLAAAWVFHPVAWLLSRTLMSDVPAVALILVSMDQWEQGRAGRSAFALGYALLARLGSLMAAAGVGLAVLVDRPRWRDVAILALGPVAAGLAVAGLNAWMQGSPLGEFYGDEGMKAFTGRKIPQHLLLYAGGLLLLPPFPLACLLLRPRACDRWALAAVPCLTFFVIYSYHDSSASPVETFVGGQRLILGAHAVLVVATMRVWAAVPPRRFRMVATALAAACAAGGSRVAQRKLEARFLPAVEAARACHPRRLAFNVLALRVAAAVDAREYHTLRRGSPAPPADVGVVAPRRVTRSTRTSATFEVPPEWAATGRCTQAGAFLVFDLAGSCRLPPPSCVLPPPAASPAR